MTKQKISMIAISISSALIKQALGDAYYISPTGNDSNNGTSPSAPWQTLAKVDSTTFAPGSQVLFQDGGNWYGQQLIANSSGTTSNPIVYGSYGSGINPTFWGSNIIPSSSFQPVLGEANTYFYPTTTPVNAFLVNHQFTHDAPLVSGQTSDAGNISYVENTPNSSYYDSNASGLYVNIGSPIIPSNVYTAAVIGGGVILDNNQNNITFQNLTVEESAEYNSGYGIAIQKTTNVQVLNSTVIAAGKHSVGVIDSTGFLGENINSSNLMPDQGYGGASAYVSYADATTANTTSQWVNDTFNNPNGPYPALITHSDPSATNPTPISNLLVKNLVTDANPAITVYTSGSEQVNIVGGHVTNGSVQLEGSNTTLKGMLLTGANAEIDIGSGGVGGSGNTIENTIINGTVPNWWSGHDGAIVDSGTGTIIRFNTIILGPTTSNLGAAIGLENNTTNTQIYGNIIDTPYAAFFQHDTGTPEINATNNLFAGTSNPRVIYFSSSATSITNWPTTISADEIYDNPNILDTSMTIDRSLIESLSSEGIEVQPDSIAEFVYDPTTNSYVMYNYYPDITPTQLLNLEIAIPEPHPYQLLLLALPMILLPRRRINRGN